MPVKLPKIPASSPISEPAKPPVIYDEWQLDQLQLMKNGEDFNLVARLTLTDRTGARLDDQSRTFKIRNILAEAESDPVLEAALTQAIDGLVKISLDKGLI